MHMKPTAYLIQRICDITDYKNKVPEKIDKVFSDIDFIPTSSVEQITYRIKTLNHDIDTVLTEHYELLIEEQFLRKLKEKVGV